MSGPVTATATTIHDVWIYTKQRRRKPDVFDLSLSPAGVVVLRPGRTAQRLGWDRISEWEIEKRQGYVLLTLRGGGSTTRLVITGWSVEDLDAVIQQAMHGTAAPGGGATKAPSRTTSAKPAAAAGAAKTAGAPTSAATSAANKAAASKAATPTQPATKAPVPRSGAAARATPRPAAPAAPVTATSVTAASRTAGSGAAPAPAAAPDAPEPEPAAWEQLSSWKPVVTVVLIGVLAFAVIVVLLQSAGIIDWGFLGPTA